jgi:hypothetical protein
MLQGLLWFPLLFFFIWLAGAGWNEFQKLEAYKRWAIQYDRAKYDIYAVLGQQGRELSWGLPTRQGPINVQTFSLDRVQTVQLWVNGAPADLEHPPRKGKSELAFVLDMAEIRVPFTDPELAARWGQVLQKEIGPEFPGQLAEGAKSVPG